MIPSTKKQFDYSSKTWGVLPITNKYTSFQGLEIDFFLKDIAPLNPATAWKVMDVGSGGGNIAGYFKSVFPKWKIYGFDVSSQSVALAKKNFPKVDFEVSLAEKIPVSREKYDLIYSFDVFEHLPNLSTTVNKLNSTLKNGGILYVAIPLEKQFLTLYWFMQKLGWVSKTEYAGHINIVDKKDFVKLIEQNGFKLIKYKYSGHLLFTLVDIILYVYRSLTGKNAESIELAINQRNNGFTKTALTLGKNIFSVLTYFESKIFFFIPGGKGHFMFEKVDGDFFSNTPPFTLLEKYQLKYGLTKFLRPKDLAIKKYLDKLGFSKAKVIMDVGCANGIWLERLLAKGKKKGWGIDVSDRLLKQAQERKAACGSYFNSNYSWKVPSNSTDICVSFDTFEHINNKKQELLRIHKSLKKGGKILIYTLNKNHKYTFDWLVSKLGSDFLYKRADHQLEKFPTPKGLANMLKQVGFKKVGYELFDGPVNLFWAVFCYSYLFLLEKILVFLKAEWLLNAVLEINSFFIRLFYGLNTAIDRVFTKSGNSNGFFIWAEK